MVLPVSLRTLAGVGDEEVVEVPGRVCVDGVLDALEAAHPALRGTIRDRVTGRRRPFMRYFADGEDISHEPGTLPLAPAVARGEEPLRVVGAISGG